MRVVLEEALITGGVWPAARTRDWRARLCENSTRRKRPTLPLIQVVWAPSRGGHLMTCQERRYDIYGPSPGARLFRKVLENPVAHIYPAF
jgi:hypothetical protein